MAMRNRCEPEDVYKYNSIIRDIDNIIEYFERMSRSLSHIADEATHLSRKINKIIEDGNERTRHAIDQSLQL